MKVVKDATRYCITIIKNRELPMKKNQTEKHVQFR
jgi:hypothetical protein